MIDNSIYGRKWVEWITSLFQRSTAILTVFSLFIPARLQGRSCDESCPVIEAEISHIYIYARGKIYWERMKYCSSFENLECQELTQVLRDSLDWSWHFSWARDNFRFPWTMILSSIDQTTPPTITQYSNTNESLAVWRVSCYPVQGWLALRGYAARQRYQ